METKLEKTVCSLTVLFVIAVMAFSLYCPYREMKTFNKYKSANQPEATYMDALCSKLRISTE